MESDRKRFLKKCLNSKISLTQKPILTQDFQVFTSSFRVEFHDEFQAKILTQDFQVFKSSFHVKFHDEFQA